MSWQFDEVAHAGPEHLDAGYVAAFDLKAQTDWSEEIATLLALGIGPASTIVGFGAGTGTFAEAIAGRVARVVSVDISPAMVATMQARGLEAVRAGLLSYEHVGVPPDAIFSSNALRHLPDFWKAIALQRIARLLRPGGVLRLSDIIYSSPTGPMTSTPPSLGCRSHAPVRRARNPRPMDQRQPNICGLLLCPALVAAVLSANLAAPYSA
jgi:SAM-dependent methyltransferase